MELSREYESSFPPSLPRAERRGDDTRGAWRLALLVTLGAALVRLLLAAALPLFPDETYYWEWSRRLAGGYFDHPYGIAALVRAGTSLWAAFGLAPTPLAVRLGPVLAGALATLAAVATARRVAGDGAALRAAFIVSALPLAATGLVLATPDAPLLATAAGTLYFVTRALQAAPKSRAALGWWTLAGVALGLAFSSKYTAVLIPAGVLLAVALRRDLRARLAEPGPYVACIVATLVFLPVLGWNASHGWISFVFQLQHGLGTPKGSALLRELDLVGGQAGLASPVLFVMMAIAVWHALKGAQPVKGMLAVVATFVFGFFAYSALRKHVEANWPAPAYIPAAVLVAAYPWGQRGRKWLIGGTAFAGALALVVYVHAVVPVLPIPPRRDPVAKAFGWDAVAAVAPLRTPSSEIRGRNFLAADRYQDASELAFHLNRRYRGPASIDPTDPYPEIWEGPGGRIFSYENRAVSIVFSVNQSGRTNQYDLWPRFPFYAKPGDNLWLILDDSDDMHSSARRLAPYFSELRRLDRISLARNGREYGARRWYLLVGWKGGWPEPALR